MRLIRLLKNDLAREASDWVADGIISSAQAEIICNRYGIDLANWQPQSFAYRILITLGYLFIGLAVIVLLGANWDELPRAVRMLGLIAITIGVNLFGWRQYRRGDSKAATACFFLGGLFYGASIMLIAQIYHIGEHYPDGILWWALGVLPTALLLNSVWLTLFSACLAVLWLFVESSLGFYPTLFPIFIIAMAWMIYQGKQSILLFLVLIFSCGLWLEYSLAWYLKDSLYFHFGREHIYLTVGFFIACYGIGKLLMAQENSKWIDYGTVLNLWVLRFAIVFLLIFSFEELWRKLLGANLQHATLVMIFSLALSTIAVFATVRARANLLPVSFMILCYLASLAFVIIIHDRDYAIVLQVLDNTILLGMGIWLLLKGLHAGISHYFFLGVAVILAMGLLRYIDLIGDYIGGATLFFVFAMILLAAAKYWKKQQTKQEASHA